MWLKLDQIDETNTNDVKTTFVIREWFEVASTNSYDRIQDFIDAVHRTSKWFDDVFRRLAEC